MQIRALDNAWVFTFFAGKKRKKMTEKMQLRNLRRVARSEDLKDSLVRYQQHRLTVMMARGSLSMKIQFHSYLVVLVCLLACSRLSARCKASLWNSAAILLCGFWTLNSWRISFSHRISGLCVSSRALTTLFVHGSLNHSLLTSYSYVTEKRKGTSIIQWSVLQRMPSMFPSSFKVERIEDNIWWDANFKALSGRFNLSCFFFLPLTQRTLRWKIINWELYFLS